MPIKVNAIDSTEQCDSNEQYSDDSMSLQKIVDDAR
jgi:hypothetical protein